MSMIATRMDTPITITSGEALNPYMAGELPILMMISHGESLKTDVKTELEKVALAYAGRLVVIKADTTNAPEIVEYFEVGKHPLLIGYAEGEVKLRRSRPWGPDVMGAVEALVPFMPAEAVAAAPTAAPVVAEQPQIDKILDKPVKVTDATFEAEVLQSDIPVVVDFWAEWCGPCHMIAPTLEKLAKEFAGQVKVAKVNVDENQGVAQALRIMSIPTLLFVKDGKNAGTIVGVQPEAALRDVFNQLIALEV